MREELTHLPTKPFRVRIIVSYDGSPFCGWQSQLIHKTKNSIQSVLEKTLSRIFKEDIHCVASGRTDAGVHATGQNVHFDVSRDPRTLPLLKALRTALPPTISVRRAWLVSARFSALSSAAAKTYRYYIWTDVVPSAIFCRFTYWYPQQLNVEKLQKYADEFVGRHDFKTFQAAGGRPPKSSVRRVVRARWSQPKQNLFIFEISGNGFLRQMVRNIVSTQLRLMEQGAPPTSIKQLIKAFDRGLIGKAAPANGLFLAKVHYPKEILAEAIALD